MQSYKAPEDDWKPDTGEDLYYVDRSELLYVPGATRWPFGLFLRVWGWVGPEDALRYMRTVRMTADQVAMFMRLPWTAGWVDTPTWTTVDKFYRDFSDDDYPYLHYYDREENLVYRYEDNSRFWTTDLWNYKAACPQTILASLSATDRVDLAACGGALSAWLAATDAVPNLRTLRAAVKYNARYDWGDSEEHRDLYELLMLKGDTKVIPRYFAGSIVQVIKEMWSRDDGTTILNSLIHATGPVAVRLLQAHDDINFYRELWHKGNNEWGDVLQTIYEYYGRDALREGIAPEFSIDELESCATVGAAITHDDLRVLAEWPAYKRNYSNLYTYVLDRVDDLRPYERFIYCKMQDDRCYDHRRIVQHLVSRGAIARLLGDGGSPRRASVLEFLYAILSRCSDGDYLTIMDALDGDDYLFGVFDSGMYFAAKRKYKAIAAERELAAHVDALQQTVNALGGALDLCNDMSKNLATVTDAQKYQWIAKYQSLLQSLNRAKETMTVDQKRKINLLEVVDLQKSKYRKVLQKHGAGEDI